MNRPSHKQIAATMILVAAAFALSAWAAGKLAAGIAGWLDRPRCYVVVKTWESALNNRDGKLEYRGPGYGQEVWEEKRQEVSCDR